MLVAARSSVPGVVCATVLGCGGAADPESPLYGVVASGLDADVTRIFSVSTLDAAGTEELDGQRVRGYAGRRGVSWLPGSGLLYVTAEGNQGLIEIAFDGAGQQHERRTLSLTEHGMAPSAQYFNVFVSPTKAYLLTTSSDQVVAWNPRTMQAIKAFSLGLDVGEAQLRLYTSVPPSGDQLVLVSSSIRTPVNDGILNDTTIIALDTREDEVISRRVETRCAGLWSRRQGPDATYFITSALQAELHAQSPELVPAPCLLRIRAGETSFDPTWMGSLTDQVGSRLWGGFSAGPDGTSLTRVAPEESLEDLSEAGLSLFSAPIWQWWKTELDGSAASPLESLGTSSAERGAIEVDSRVYTVSTDPETRADTLIDITDPERPTHGLTSSTHRIINVQRLR